MSRRGNKGKKGASDRVVSGNVIYYNFGADQNNGAQTQAQAGAQRTAQDHQKLPDPKPFLPGSEFLADDLISPLMGNMDSGRLSRGRDLARSGAVIRCEVKNWELVAEVVGTQPAPYMVVGTLFHRESAVDDAVNYLAKNPKDYQHFLEGRYVKRPYDLLCPIDTGLEWECDCPDSHGLCKHIFATALELSELYDVEPFRFLEWSGLTEQSLRLRVQTERAQLGIPDEDSPSGGDQDSETEENTIDEPPAQQPGASEHVDPTAFWDGGELQIPDLKPYPALEEHDNFLLMRALSWVSYGAVGQVAARADLEDCYHHMMHSASDIPVVDVPGGAGDRTGAARPETETEPSDGDTGTTTNTERETTTATDTSSKE